MNEDAAERICWHIYGTDTVALALKQGWTDAVRHLEALRANNADRVAFTHPYNYLTEAQVEAIIPVEADPVLEAAFMITSAEVERAERLAAEHPNHVNQSTAEWACPKCGLTEAQVEAIG